MFDFALFQQGRELIRIAELPIVHQPPAYQRSFCDSCGSLVPLPDIDGPQEIPAGSLHPMDLKPDRHIFVESYSSASEFKTCAGEAVAAANNARFTANAWVIGRSAQDDIAAPFAIEAQPVDIDSVARARIYEDASFVVDTDRLGVDEVARELIKKLKAA